MTVVLFCGGLGLRLRDHAHQVPKPMVKIGGAPILRHLMRYYASYGHGHFVLCLGYGAEVVRRHFAGSPDCVTVETLPDEAVRVHLRSDELGRCTVDLVPTGHEASIGERLRAARRYITQDIFLANYADGLSDLDLPHFLARFAESGAAAGLITVRSPSTLHLVSVGSGGLVEEVQPAAATDLRVNGGFFAMRRQIFDELVPGEDLVGGLFPRLVAGRRLFGYCHDGFWACMDTPKDRRLLEDMDARGHAPWKVWLGGGGAARPGTSPAQSLLGVRVELAPTTTDVGLR
jgi:glucose-1-phosphate cytidylyltransferase